MAMCGFLAMIQARQKSTFASDYQVIMLDGTKEKKKRKKVEKKKSQEGFLATFVRSCVLVKDEARRACQRLLDNREHFCEGSIAPKS